MKLYMPIINGKATEKTRADYVSELKRAGADRVYIAPSNFYGREPEQSREISLLKENLEYFTEQGFETAVWINGLGHGGNLDHENHNKTGDYVHLRGLGNAGEAGDSFCPFDRRFTEMYGNYVRAIAKAGAKMIMIDDDLRIGLHGACAIGCACDLHIAEYNRRGHESGLIPADRNYTREELAEILFTGKTNEYRKLWLQLQGDTMRGFCSEMRSIVDSVNPEIRLGHCACLNTWDVDGIDSIEMSRILAGGTKPFLRLIGAAYWNNNHSFGTTGLGSIIDLERMEAAWCERYAPDIEIFSEGDLYTRPRYVTPHMYVEDFDQVLLAEHCQDAILKYMLDYTYDPLYETGYIDRHVYFRPLREAIDKAFADKNTAGVYVHEIMHKLEDMDCTGMTEGQIISNFCPSSLNFTNMTALPSSFMRTPFTGAALIFGENAKYLNADTEGLPMILDALAAEILQDKGIDTGFVSSESAPVSAGVHFVDENIDHALKGGGVFRRFTLREGAKPVAVFSNGNIAAYTYENADGYRFLVFSFEAEKSDMAAGWIRCYPFQRMLFSAYEWLCGKPLPVKVWEQPEIYALARCDRKSMAVGIWNFYKDIALPRFIELGDDYSEIEFIGEISGRMEGRRVYLDRGIYSYGFAGFVVKK